MIYDVPATEEARRLGVNRLTLINAIRNGRCQGEDREGHWYTSYEAANAWYQGQYRHRRALYSKVAGKRWSEEDVAKLSEMVNAGATLAEIAKALQREERACRVKASKLGLTRQDRVEDKSSTDGRVRLHFHPVVASRLKKTAKKAGLSLAEFLTRAGLAAVAEPTILIVGMRETKK